MSTTTNLTRRQALTGSAAGAAAIVAGAAPAIANEHLDAALLALGRQHDAIYDKVKEAERRIDLVAPPRPEPIKPEALKVRAGDAELGIPAPRDCGFGVPDTYGWQEVDRLRERRRVRSYNGPIKLAKPEYNDPREVMTEVLSYVEARYEPWPEAQARADEIVAAHDAHIAERNGPEHISDAVAEIEAEIDGYGDEMRPVADAIVAMRATTIDGLKVKARAIRWIYFDDPDQLMAEANGTDDELLRSITVDLWAMQEGQS